MRAAIYDKYGDPEVLHEGQVTAPLPKPGEILVKVHAVSVNGIDLIVRAGTLKMFTGKTFPRRTGLDFAGVVAGLGEGARDFGVGDQVWGALPHGQTGSAADFVAVPPEQLSLTPKGLDLLHAAALPAVGVTALTALRDIGGLTKGQKLLVRGASGGVGAIAIQLGRALGAHVTGLASAGNLDLVRQLGADTALDYATTKPSDLGSFHVVLDTVGSHTGAYRRLLTAKGRMITIVPDPKHPVTSMAYVWISKIHGSRQVRFFSAKPQTSSLKALAAYVESGAIRPVVEKVYPLSEIAAAHRAMEGGGRRGKQVIRIAA